MARREWAYRTGAELKVGDVVSVWWCPTGARITSLTPYRGPLEPCFTKGASVAQFDVPLPNRSEAVGMTIDHAAWDYLVFFDSTKED